jgi:hypothetical protein
MMTAGRGATLKGKPMNTFARAHNQYLDPPDDDPICEDGCGETMTRDITGEWYCVNKYCPLKFDEGSTEREMAEMLIGAQEEIKSLSQRLRAKTRDTENAVRLVSYLDAFMDELEFPVSKIYKLNELVNRINALLNKKKEV